MMAAGAKTKYDLNLLLGIANVAVFVACIYLYNGSEDNNLVNIPTLILVGIFAGENIGMLAFEKKRKNPFIIILVVVMTFFYLARVATILHMPASISPYGFSFIPSAMALNDALIFIVLANASMFAGFCLAGAYNKDRAKISGKEDHSPQLKKAFIIIALVVMVTFSDMLNFESLGRLTGFIQNFFNRNTILLFTFTMLIYHFHRISSRSKMLMVLTIAAIIILITLSGSRSGILTVGMALLMGALAVEKRIMIGKRAILIGSAMILLAIVFFAAATLKLDLKIKDTVTVQHLVSAHEKQEDGSNLVNKYLPQMYYRLGFLDFSTELIANRQKFAELINGSYYAKSIVDNVLTPGFNVFDTPKASNCLTYVRNGQPIPGKDHLEKFYHTDQMGIYGEYYVFFNGYLALAAFFFLALIYQFIYDHLNAGNDLLTCIYKAVLINVFYIWLNSFGMDWFIFDLITIVITTLIFARFYISQGTRKVPFRADCNNDADSNALPSRCS